MGTAEFDYWKQINFSPAPLAAPWVAGRGPHTRQLKATRRVTGSDSSLPMHSAEYWCIVHMLRLLACRYP
jgi:hypothetical protein